MITLKGMTWDHPRGYDPLVACSATYAAAGVRVEWDKRSLKDFGDQPLDQLYQDYDLLVIDHPHVGISSATGYLLPLDEYLPPSRLQTLAAQSAGPSHESYHYNGHQWALALDAAMQTAVYRADLLPGNVPSTWDAVLALGESLRATGHYIAMPLGPTDAMCSFITLCASLGEAIGSGETLLNDARIGHAALQLLADITALSHPDSRNWNPIQMLDTMSATDDIVYCPLSFCYTNYSRADFRAKLLTFTAIPGTRGAILGGTGFAVSAATDHPRAACAYGAWLCSADVQAGEFVRAGGQPGNSAAWHSDAANVLTNNFFANTLPTLEASIIRPRHAGFTVFQEEAGVIVHDFLWQKLSRDACFEAMTALYDAHKPEVQL